MYFHELELTVESILRNTIRGSYPIDWDEDFITRRILGQFRDKLGHTVVEGFKTDLNVSWEPYKLSGTAEKKYGDIAIIMNICYRDGDIVNGVAFLEAKKRDSGKTSFSALKFDQIQRIYHNVPHAQVLLYDYEDVTEFASNLTWTWDVHTVYARSSHRFYTECTCAVAVPSQNVISVRKKDSSLYKLGLPFSHQLCFRYFHGFDLDHTRQALEIATGCAYKKGFPKYVLVVKVIHGKQQPEFKYGPNKDMYTFLED